MPETWLIDSLACDPSGVRRGFAHNALQGQARTGFNAAVASLERSEIDQRDTHGALNPVDRNSA
jgi:hypothetical protein